MGQGAPGKDATVDYNTLVSKIDYNTLVSKLDYNTLGTKVNIQSTTLGTSGTSTNAQMTFAQMSDAEQNQFVKIAITNHTSVINDILQKANQNLKSSTLWCADGDLCEVPSGKGIRIGGEWVINTSTSGNLNITNTSYNTVYPFNRQKL